MVYVVATIELAAGTRDQFLAEFHKIVPAVLEEKGCLHYQPTTDLKTEIPAQPVVRENVVSIVEWWESLADLQAHLAAPHMAEYRGKVKDFVVSATLQITQPA